MNRLSKYVVSLENKDILESILVLLLLMLLLDDEEEDCFFFIMTFTALECSSVRDIMITHAICVWPSKQIYRIQFDSEEKSI